MFKGKIKKYLTANHYPDLTGQPDIPESQYTETILEEDYTVTPAGEKVMEAVAPAAGLYIVELAIGGVLYIGDNDLFNGTINGKVVADIEGESDQTDSTSNFRTFAGVTGMPFYERGHSTAPYASGIDLFWRSAQRINNTYGGTVYGSHQWAAMYLSTGGKVELYLRDSATVIDGGYHKVLAGSKIILRQLATYTFPAALP